MCSCVHAMIPTRRPEGHFVQSLLSLHLFMVLRSSPCCPASVALFHLLLRSVVFASCIVCEDFSFPLVSVIAEFPSVVGLSWSWCMPYWILIWHPVVSSMLCCFLEKVRAVWSGADCTEMPAQLPHINFLMLSHLLRIFHEQKILQKVFGEWREEWWVSQRE